MHHDHIKVIRQKGRNNTTRNNKKNTKIKNFHVKWLNMAIIGLPSFKLTGRKELDSSNTCIMTTSRSSDKRVETTPPGRVKD